MGELKEKKNIAIFAVQYLVFVKKTLHSTQDLQAFNTFYMINSYI